MQSSDPKRPVKTLYPVEHIRDMCDCSLTNVKRHRRAAAVVNELKRKNAN